MSEIEIHGGPLNGYRVQPGATLGHPDGRYELSGGAYHWHSGQAEDETSTDETSTEDAPAEQDAEQDAEVEHVRPKRRPRTTTRGKATPGGA